MVAYIPTHAHLIDFVVLGVLLLVLRLFKEWSTRWIFVPLLWIVMWPILGLLRLFSPRSRESAIKCPGCGYDLRGMPDVCPECGRKVEALNSVIIKYQMKLDGRKNE